MSNNNIVRYAFQLNILLFLFLAFPTVLLPNGQNGRETDLKAINQLLDRYRASEDEGDHKTQGQLMSSDRVWVSNTTGRRIDNLENMRIQQAQADRRKKAIPGLRQFSEDRDIIIKFYADGKVAVVTFFRKGDTDLPVRNTRWIDEGI